MRQLGLIDSLARCCDSSVYFKVTLSGSLPGASRKHSEGRIQERNSSLGREQKQWTESYCRAASGLGKEQSGAVGFRAVP